MTEIHKVIASLVPEFKAIAKKLSHNKTDIDDAVQELCLYFMTINPKVLKDIYTKDGEKGLLSYAYIALRRSFYSKKSKFYYTYKKYYTNLIPHYETDDTLKQNINNSIYNYPETIDENYREKKLKKIEKELESLYWYDSQIFKLYYYESNTYDSLAKKTGISRNSLFNTIDKVRKIIKENLNE